MTQENVTWRISHLQRGKKSDLVQRRPVLQELGVSHHPSQKKRLKEFGIVNEDIKCIGKKKKNFGRM